MLVWDTQMSLRIGAVCLESSLAAWRKFASVAIKSSQGKYFISLKVKHNMASEDMENTKLQFGWLP